MMANKRKVRIEIIIILVIILIDQISKILAITNGIVEYQVEKTKEEILSSLVTDIVVFFIIIKFLKEQSKNMDKKTKITLSLILGRRNK